MCGFYCIAFIECMLPLKTLLDYTNLFCPNHYKKNDKIIYKYFKDKYDKIKRKSSFQTEENTSNKKLSFRLKKHNDLMNEKYQKVCRALNYFKNFIVFVSCA